MKNLKKGGYPESMKEGIFVDFWYVFFLHIQGVQKMMCGWCGLEVKVVKMAFWKCYLEENGKYIFFLNSGRKKDH